MPNDSLYINSKSAVQHTYDAIVVGSGISGGWAAKELTQKGLKVLMLERGARYDHVKDYATANKHPWQFEHRGAVSEQQRIERPLISRGCRSGNGRLGQRSGQSYCRGEAVYLVAHLPHGRAQHTVGAPKLPLECSRL